LINDVEFDYSKSKRLSALLSECERSLESVTHSLKKELTNVGNWWTGESYDEYKNSFDNAAGVKSFLNTLLEETNRTARLLLKIENLKKEFEKNSFEKFE